MSLILHGWYVFKIALKRIPKRLLFMENKIVLQNTLDGQCIFSLHFFSMLSLIGDVVQLLVM